MRAPISVIIPTLDSANCLSATAAALFEGLETGLIREMIVSDGGSGDATLELAEELGARIISGKPGRGGQLGRGGEAAQGEFLLFLHSDTWLAEGWSKPVFTHINNSKKAACFRLSFRAKGTPARIVAGWANLRTRVFGLPYGDQGLLISRALYDEIGGYQDIPLMEDVAIARMLKGRLVLLDGTAQTDAEKFIRSGWLKRGTQNLWRLLRFFMGVSPERLAKRY